MYDEEPQIIREADDDVTKRKTQEEEKRREQAFNAGYAWKGETFEGLSCSRKDLWIALCYKAGFPPLKAGFDDLQWFVPQAKALVWVCLVPKKQLRRLRSLGIDAVLEEFTEWVDQNVSMKDETVIIDLGQRLLIDANENQAEAAPSTGGTGK